ncbi:Predicted small integral membrane protein [Altererythrobacter xiamenensis]|uniref:Predicted small integral membrane protein n=1 Tax=Altererythrobacter xiamenensis TaxID=1316679 RepID=A0A1Y6FIG3_9SPHN|nr:DUF2165 family protein [Altererythrobacter xiamenensis]SMQ74748.1 Predicted small integral membrane protein [Altererythrobacter xiamenensis]
MTDRYLKSLFMVLLGLMALFYVGHNIINLSIAHQNIGYVLSQKDHAIYPANIMPAVGDGPAWIVLAVIFVSEIAAGVVCLWGGWKLWSGRSDTAAYASALNTAKIGCGLVIFTWFGLFNVFGGAAYNMWQTQIGHGSMSDAFTFAAFGFFVLIYLGQREAEA